MGSTPRCCRTRRWTGPERSARTNPWHPTWWCREGSPRCSGYSTHTARRPRRPAAWFRHPRCRRTPARTTPRQQRQPPLPQGHRRRPSPRRRDWPQGAWWPSTRKRAISPSRSAPRYFLLTRPEGRAPKGRQRQSNGQEPRHGEGTMQLCGRHPALSAGYNLLVALSVTAVTRETHAGSTPFVVHAWAAGYPSAGRRVAPGAKAQLRTRRIAAPFFHIQIGPSRRQHDCGYYQSCAPARGKKWARPA